MTADDVLPAAQSAGDTPNVDKTTKTQQPSDEHGVDESQINMRYAADLWEALTHCAEPEGYHELTELFERAVRDEEKAKSPVPLASPQHDGENKIGANFWLPDDRYTFTVHKNQTPERPSDWPESYRLILTEDRKDESDELDRFFQVFRTETDERTILTQDTHARALDVPQLNVDVYVFKFGRKYRYDASAFDEDGELISMPYSHLNSFNAAEHAALGDNLRLRWSADKTQEGSKELQINKDLKLSYGQINALGGDFFATLTPICFGKTLDEQCALFKKAYATLAEDQEVAKKILKNREAEFKAIHYAVQKGESTSEAYKRLFNPITGTFGMIDKSDKELTEITWTKDPNRPSYVRIAQLNLDHFGVDGRTAYNAGHTCALRAAAAGNLELGYTMNAFADHFLQDAFAAGHIRTPRRKLHGKDSDVQHAIDILLSIARGEKGIGELRSIGFGNTLDALAPDFCSKFMHDEDNSLGLWVNNRRNDHWQAFGDKKLFAKENQNNKRLLLECLQVSADEVYKAFETGSVPVDPNQSGVWRIAPTGLDSKNHSPLFNEKGHYRTDYDDPKSTEYSDPSSFFSMGYKLLSLALSNSDTFKRY